MLCKIQMFLNLLTFGLCEGVSERERLIASVKRNLYKKEHTK